MRVFPAGQTVRQNEVLEQEGFDFVAGARFMRSHRFVSEKRGIYVLLIRDGDKLLEAAGYSDMGGAAAPAWTVGNGEYTHLYTGCSGNLRMRVKRHLVRDVRVSSFRKSLLALDAKFGVINATGHPFPMEPHQEAGLDLWLAMHGVVGFRRCEDDRASEAELLARSPSPLNAQGRPRTPFDKMLLRATAEFDGRFLKPL
jgi:hypothetical protein